MVFYSLAQNLENEDFCISCLEHTTEKFPAAAELCYKCVYLRQMCLLLAVFLCFN